MASSRRVGVLGRSVGQAALRTLSAVAVAVLSSSRAARCASLGSTPVGQVGGPTGADVPGCGATGGTPTASARGYPGTLRPSGHRIGAAVIAIVQRIGAVHAVIDVVVGGGPEGVIGVGIEGVVDEIVIGVGPEHRADKADDERRLEVAMMMMVVVMVMFPPAALERRSRQRGAFQGTAGPVAEPFGKRRIAQHAIGVWLVHAGQLERPRGRITDVGNRRTAARLLRARHVQVGTVAAARTGQIADCLSLSGDRSLRRRAARDG
jgi:hypothetical protein